MKGGGHKWEYWGRKKQKISVEKEVKKKGERQRIDETGLVRRSDNNHIWQVGDDFKSERMNWPKPMVSIASHMKERERKVFKKDCSGKGNYLSLKFALHSG